MKFPAERLKRMTSTIFAAAGCNSTEAERIGHYLVESNLVGHDSHGVIRIPPYVQWLRDGKVVPNQSLRIVLDHECLAVVDGGFGFGQVIGEQAVRLGIQKASAHGMAAVALRNCGHLGRIGDWPQLAAEAGLISLHFVNTSGLGNLVAPWGGIERRLSANPVAIGVPVAGRAPLVMDISTSAIAEGKIKVARNKGVKLPDGCVIDSRGQPTNDPHTFYDEPGSILPFGGHKGYALGLMAEMLAGALTGNGCTAPGVTRLSNGLLSIYLDPAKFGDAEAFTAEVRRYITYVQSSKLRSPDAEILMPGDLEDRYRRQRLTEGIELDDTTVAQIRGVAESLSVAVRPDLSLSD